MRTIALSILAGVSVATLLVASPAPTLTDLQTLAEIEAFAVSHPHPDYPLEARRLRLAGRGIVAGIVDRKTGRLKSVKMAQSTGHVILDEAVLRAFRQWKFRPGTIGQFRVPVIYTMVARP